MDPLKCIGYKPSSNEAQNLFKSCVDNFTKDALISEENGWEIGGNISNVSSSKNFDHKALSLSLIMYGFPVIIIAGTIGNMLSFVVMLRRRMRHTSIYFYLTCLSLADTVVLYGSAFKTWIRLMTGFEMLHVSSVGCKFFMFLLLVSLHMSAWIIVLVATDRCVAVWFPFKAQMALTIRRARCFVLLLLIVTLLSNSHVFWTIHLHVYTSELNNSTQYACAPHEDNVFMLEYFEYLKFVSYSALPFIIVLALNISIILKIARSAKAVIQNGGTSTPEAAADKHRSQQRVTYMLLIITFTWLVLSAPFTMYSLIVTNLKLAKQPAVIFLVKTVCFLLMYLNHSINFYLYCITGKKFRTELKQILGCGDGKRRRRNYQNADKLNATHQQKITLLN